jgi:hypothetical protein
MTDTETPADELALLLCEIDDILTYEPQSAGHEESPPGPAGDGGASDHATTWEELVEVGSLLWELPSELGGFGLGLPTTVTVAERLAHHLYLGPWLDTLLALDILVAARDGHARRLAEGGTSVAVARCCRRPRCDHQSVLSLGDAGEGTVMLDVEAAGVPFAGVVDDVLAVGRVDDHCVAALLPRGHTSVVSTGRGDDGVGAELSDVHCTRAPVPAGQVMVLSASAYHLSCARAELRQAAHLVGLAQGALSVATRRVTQRQQFGRPIGQFQAVATALARHTALVESVRALVAETATADPDKLKLRAPQALAVAAEYARGATSYALHLCGAAGLMKDAPAQRYYRQAFVDSRLNGSPPEIRTGVADALLDQYAAARACPGTEVLSPSSR